MAMRRWWGGSVAVLVLGLAAACRDAPPPAAPPDQEVPRPGVSSAEQGVKEDTLERVATLECPAIRTERPRSVELNIEPDSSHVVRFESGGRSHSVMVWGDPGPRRRLILREMPGDSNGVRLTLTPAPTSALAPWAVLTLDASGCRPGSRPIVVKIHDSGVITRTQSAFDSTTQSAVAVLRGNSGYMLATPD